jgi:hypothetical protein
MAGISAASVTKTHSAASSDDTATGFLKNEQIALSVSPSGSAYSWSIAIPSDSAPAQSALDDADVAAPKFTPDVPGFYTLTCVVDGATTHVLRIAVVAVAVVRAGEGFNLMPLANSQVPTPKAGVVLYYSTDSSKAVVKDTSGTVTPLY